MVAELSKQGSLQGVDGPRAPLNSSLVCPATTTRHATFVALVAVSLATQVATERQEYPLSRVSIEEEQVLGPLQKERQGEPLSTGKPWQKKEIASQSSMETSQSTEIGSVPSKYDMQVLLMSKEHLRLQEFWQHSREMHTINKTSGSRGTQRVRPRRVAEAHANFGQILSMATRESLV